MYTLYYIVFSTQVESFFSTTFYSGRARAREPKYIYIQAPGALAYFFKRLCVAFAPPRGPPTTAGAHRVGFLLYLDHAGTLHAHATTLPIQNSFNIPS